MAGEAPGGGAVQTGGREGVEAQFVLAGMDVFGNGLQGGEILDVGQGVAGLFKQRLVGDDAERFVAVADAERFTVFAVEVELGGGQLVVEVGVAQIKAEILPCVKTGLVAALEQRGGRTCPCPFRRSGFHCRCRKRR